MNRRIGRLAAVVVVLAALSSSAACGSDSTKTDSRGAPSGPISSSTMPDSPSTNPTNFSGTPSRLTPDPTDSIWAMISALSSAAQALLVAAAATFAVRQLRESKRSRAAALLMPLYLEINSPESVAVAIGCTTNCPKI